MKRLCTLILMVALLVQGRAVAQEAPPIRLIRDAEIENIIRAWATPVFTAAGLDPAAVQVHLVNDPRLNAFVAGGQHIFLTTGLLMRSEHAGQVIGVLAHETGHIADGHLARLGEALERATWQSIAAMVLGAAIAVASGRGDAGVAVIGAGQGSVVSNFLSYTRTQESAADQFAVTMLDRTGQSSRGMLEFLQILRNQEFLVVSRQDPYVRTHPITATRVDFVRNHVAGSPWSGVMVPEYFEVMHRMMRAKLVGFLLTPLETLQRYPESDTSPEALYARAIAWHLDARLDRARPAIDSLVALEPENPYFHELRGQILFESGLAAEALGSYERAVALAPNEALLRTSLGQVQLELNDPGLIPPALANLVQSTRLDPDIPYTWRLLATGYGRLGDQGMTALSLAEESVILRQGPSARRNAERARDTLSRGSPEWQRAQDILQFVEDERNGF